MRVTLAGMFLGLLTAAFIASAALSEPVEFRLRSGELVVKGDLLHGWQFGDGHFAVVRGHHAGAEAFRLHGPRLCAACPG